MKILILGGYGVFGGRLAELLADIADIEMLICGRSLSRAEAFCATFSGKASVRALRLDRADIQTALAAERPNLVVDASGPFQFYDDDPYRVIKACVASKVDYLDFADGADFVFGVSQFDSDTKSAGIFALSGVSSFPVLTAAVLREMATTMDIVSVKGGIAPSPFAGIGLNVMRAVVGYAGSPVKLIRNGIPSIATGLAESMRYTIAVPGRLPLKNIHFSLVDVPDLQVIPPEHKTLQDIWMGAGPVPEILHRTLNVLAKTRAAWKLPSLAPLSRLFYRVLNMMRFGEHRGGMFVHAKGLAGGKPVEQSWHLLAEGDDGPYIPSMAIEAIIRKLLDGTRPAAGAGPAVRALELSDYDALFSNRTIYTGFRARDAEPKPLYVETLGESFETLPPKVKALHNADNTRTWKGHAEIKRGKSWVAAIICRLIGFPEAGSDVPVSVTLSPDKRGELWTRNFAGRRFSSVQKPGTGRNEHLVLEEFGPISVALALVTDSDKLLLIPRRLFLMGVPMPGFLLPRGISFETERDGRFCFDVTVEMPLVGLIVAYKGSLDKTSEQ